MEAARWESCLSQCRRWSTLKQYTAMYRFVIYRLTCIAEVFLENAVE